MNELVIDRPELQPPTMRAIYGALTVVLWTFYIYLLLPVATLLAWYVGYSVVYEEMLMRAGWEALLELIGYYSLVVLVMGLVQVGWASLNWVRFSGNRDRRRLHERQVNMQIDSMFMTDTTEFPAWQNAKRLVVRHHDTEHRITAVEVG